LKDVIKTPIIRSTDLKQMKQRTKTCDKDLNAALNTKNECLKDYKRPSVSGRKDVEGKVSRLPMNRQDNKSCLDT